MRDPTTPAEFEERFRRNLRVRGSGPEAEVTLPCPCCCTPGWLTLPAFALRYETPDTYCVSCQRSSRLAPTEKGDIDVVVSGGPAPAPWLHATDLTSKPVRSAGHLDPPKPKPTETR